jgi:hypothetical protein
VLLLNVDWEMNIDWSGVVLEQEVDKTEIPASVPAARERDKRAVNVLLDLINFIVVVLYDKIMHHAFEEIIKHFLWYRC